MSTWKPRSGKDLAWKVWAKHGKHESTSHLVIEEFYFEFSIFGSKMFSPHSYKLRCLAHELIRSMLWVLCCQVANSYTLLSKPLYVRHLWSSSSPLQVIWLNQSLSLLLMHLQGIHSSIRVILVPSSFHPIHQQFKKSIRNEGTHPSTYNMII